MKSLQGHVPPVVKLMQAMGRVNATNQMHLAIGLPLRDPAGLDKFLADLYDPASPNYRHYLTPQEFADRFGPAEKDYAAVAAYARSNGLTVTARYVNRLVLDVSGPVPAVEKAFRVTLRRYKHPTEGREFFSPDTEPAVDVSLPVADIGGLENYWKPKPRLHRENVMPRATPKGGTAPDGSSYLGQDLRNAYAPGVTLTGAGQIVGLLQFDGFSSNNIAAYEDLLPGKPRVPLTTVKLDGFNGAAGSGEVEVCLDIEMAIAMAPGLSRVVIFEGYLQNSMLSAMVSSNMIKNLSCSWGWGGGPSTTTDNLFKNLAAQGQSFFNASGDTDAFAAGSNNDVDNAAQPNAPSSCPYITQVGGTVLAMNGNGGSYSSETVWNDRTANPYGGNWGSSGGISTYYSSATAWWQTNVSMTAANGSTSKRNIPDVAGIASSVYVITGNRSGGAVGGTSVAAPLWAGFMALVNQQAAASGRPSVGFINPAIYTLAKSASYPSFFHDITTGDNSWSPGSPTLFHAVTNYDLCTGLGTPNGWALIYALAGPADALVASPVAGFSFSGPYGGTFAPGAGVFQMTNTSASSIDWSLINTSAWLKADLAGGTLASHTAQNVTLSLTATASNLPLGSYTSTILFSNLASHVALPYPLALGIFQPALVSPSKGFTSVGPAGGPFSPLDFNFVISNRSSSPINWSVVNTSLWLTVTATNGSLGPNSSAGIWASVGNAAGALPAAVYLANLTFADDLGMVATIPMTLSAGQPVLINGGFETGDFTGWEQSGNTGSTMVADVNSYPAYVHSGINGAELGPVSTLGYLTQNLTTLPGQNYVLSFWLRNPAGTTPNRFQAQWNGLTLYSVTNLTSTVWTNLFFVVTAADTVTPLQFGFRDDPDYIGLDDITVTPLAMPALKTTTMPAGNFQVTWNANTGLIYQVQSKTNLMQAAWVNLGGKFTAKSNTVTITDTNALTSSSQKYYRLLVMP